MLAIHPREGGFSDKWIEYCTANDITYKLVNCYSSDIITQLQGCSALMWHWAHYDHKGVLFARQLIVSLELMGIKVFPDIKTCWHFDDKVGQKYLLESINAPLVPGYVFYDKAEALQWIRESDFPKVFKLRGGAGAENVRIVKNKSEAERLIKQAFGKGFKIKSRANFLHERLWHFQRDKTLKSFFNISKGLARLFIPTETEKKLPREKNYIYFQDFIADNDHDIRIIVIGKRAFAIKRMVREGDFRASGSGFIIYEPEQIPKECVKIAFETSAKLQTQSLAYDFIFKNGDPLIVEISYAFSQKGYLKCPGYWNDKLEWTEGAFTPEFFMIEDLLSGYMHG